MEHLKVKIGVCGTISSGKSTFINAIMRDMVSDVGMGTTTTSVKKFNTRPELLIDVHPSVSYEIIDTPGCNDSDVSNQVRFATYDELTSCHIILHVVDLVLFASKNTANLEYLLHRLDSIAKESTAQNRYVSVIHAINKGDDRSSEYDAIYKSLQSFIKSRCCGRTMKINASWTCLLEYSGIDLDANKRQMLMRIHNSINPTKLVDPNMIGLDLFKYYATWDCNNSDYKLLIDAVNNMIKTNIHLMCMSNAIAKYNTGSITNKKLSEINKHAIELSNICQVFGKSYDPNTHGAHIKDAYPYGCVCS